MAEPVASIRVEGISRSDLPALAVIHEHAWPSSTITAFGRETIERYYEWLLDGPHDAAVVGAWMGADLVGFCAAGVFRGSMNGFLRANRSYLIRHITTHPHLVLSPLVRDRLREAISITLRFSRLRRRKHPAKIPPFAVLAIATNPELHGAGAGRALMAEAEQRARAERHSRMVLVVHVDNHRAIKFYEQLGWRRQLDANRGWSGTMFKPL